MEDTQLQRKLDQMLKLGNEIDQEAKRRYGEEGLLFHEADGSLLVMKRLKSDFGDQFDNNEQIMFSAKGVVEWGCGAF